jgi:hypothetical protein
MTGLLFALGLVLLFRMYQCRSADVGHRRPGIGGRLQADDEGCALLLGWGPEHQWSGGGNND